MHVAHALTLERRLQRRDGRQLLESLGRLRGTVDLQEVERIDRAQRAAEGEISRPLLKRQRLWHHHLQQKSNLSETSMGGRAVVGGALV